MTGTITSPDVSASRDECIDFIQAFAAVTYDMVGRGLLAVTQGAADEDPAEEDEEEARRPPPPLPEVDWTDAEALEVSGIQPEEVAQAREGKLLHITIARSRGGVPLRHRLLDEAGLSDKQRKALFPNLARKRFAPAAAGTPELAAEVRRLNRWFRDTRPAGYDPTLFRAHQRSLAIHGATQNESGAIGALGAALAFMEAIQEIDPDAIVDIEGDVPPDDARTPLELHRWRAGLGRDSAKTIKAILLKNGVALVFASSKDANIFKHLRKNFTTAEEALDDFNVYRNSRAQRRRNLHEFAVGEVKTATDPSNLHERMGLASRETHAEVGTDRFLMMGILNEAILAGGEQGRTLNSRDVRRFTDVFNLHHCWGFDGGRERHPDHWAYFLEKVRTWCDL